MHTFSDPGAAQLIPRDITVLEVLPRGEAEATGGKLRRRAERRSRLESWLLTGQNS